MSTKIDQLETLIADGAGGLGSEPGGRAERPAGGGPTRAFPVEVGDWLSEEVIDELLAGARTEEEIVGPGGVLARLTKRLVERALQAELTEHLGYELHQEPAGGVGNTRNGSTAKTVATEHGPVEIKTPRDRKASFEPQLVRKGQRRFEGFDDKILALYSRGLSTRDIERHLADIYGVEVGRDLVSRVTDAVMDDVREWQQRPLDDVYPVLFLDALVLKIREGGSVQWKACYLALGVTVEGERDVLGMWFQESSRRGEFHPPALTDPGVSLSTHRAPLIQPSCVRRLSTSGRTVRGPVWRSPPGTSTPGCGDDATVCISAWPSGSGSG